MHTEFWLEKWHNNDIGFHRSSVNPLLTRFIERLNLPKRAHLFLPLCGKTLDIHWLLKQGYRITGAELSEKAVQELFAELGCQPEIANIGPFVRYNAGPLTVFQGDFFSLSQSHIGGIDALYDRAALVALPASMRLRYANHLREITGSAPQLLITYDYDQTIMSGPPFSVTPQEVAELYQAHCHLDCLEVEAVEGGLKGQCEATERVWLLTPR
ncbi:thiopurine S-methyltransferase [Alteromonas aestuariivivens]|uniref:Thiopurine S-methyltransferase n=1 Tax=Alteromonas aestuariivivens TaxID=1938339 RepID=A0A3D8M9G5_9ALTE|nr:thiopurine S-methyltransferase [Alteromonas aestuariivivens]RDV26619.1 thiopurine S-methyltransferase [Alteromonas aestuariivivens]